VVTVATVVARNASESVVVPMVGTGGVCVWRESGWFRVGAFGKNLASVAVKMFSHLIYFEEILYFECGLQR
jgi:hypothetical protein